MREELWEGGGREEERRIRREEREAFCLALAPLFPHLRVLLLSAGFPSSRCLACLSYPFSYSLSTLVLSLQIHAHLPALLRLLRQWTLFYSLDQHGISLNTLYARCAPPSSSHPPHPKGALVAMQDAAGMLFGAWVADGLRRSTRGGYYGGGESFLWRYLPSSGKFDVYKWTGKNDYVALCEEGFISFGGG
ncbi:hypothetical protein B0H14DRAFT_2380082 [Mycena olivaceomarginata]|nr:hypothetical protein B0H14DRAFT_2380082 [Mycena olivaceomarginata]